MVRMPAFSNEGTTPVARKAYPSIGDGSKNRLLESRSNKVVRDPRYIRAPWGDTKHIDRNVALRARAELHTRRHSNASCGSPASAWTSA